MARARSGGALVGLLLGAATLMLVMPAGAQPQPSPGGYPSPQFPPAYPPGAYPPAYPPGYPAPAPRGYGWDPYLWEPPQVDGFDVVFVDEAPLGLTYAQPAGGPLQRFTARPGAWYTVVFVPMVPRWPLQVWLWQRVRTHELRVLALDASPWGPVSVAVPVPLRVSAAGGRPVLQTPPLALPPSSSADGVYLLLEQWSVAGDRPGPLWVQARSRIAREPAPTPWWASRSDPPAAGGAGPLAPESRASPLQTPRVVNNLLELPIQHRTGGPLGPRDPWMER